MTLERAAARLLPRTRFRRGLRIVASLSLLVALLPGTGNADPASDALARLNELSRNAERTTEAINSAQLDLDAKLSQQRTASARAEADKAALEAASSELNRYQGAVDEVAAALYMRGRTDDLSAVLIADSPQQVIDQLAVQRVVSTETARRLQDFRRARQQADVAARASTDSAAASRSAAEQAARVRAELQAQQSDLMWQIDAVKAQYAALTPQQRAVLADPGPPPAQDPAPNADPSVIAAPPPSAVHDAPAPTEGPGGRNDVVVQAALTQIGKPYSWGATGPDAFDCSGLIQWAFLQTGRKLPRSSQALAEGGQPIGQADLQPGDIVTFYSDVSHAGIYIGDGMMVHASTFGVPVKVAPISSSPFHNARRY